MARLSGYNGYAQTHVSAGCFDCGKEWDAKNSHGVAARHHQAHGHATWVEVAGIHYYGETDSMEKRRMLPNRGGDA